ncbi:hypothetical protein GP486_004718 [Trichoglossum hirsutum]|uniref:Uncharacterized protein n=1 Tax=Trichoglossum hirsutum TaxID=265104 RepID=A0A9P8RP61_9PEZI|nr:hypothetical protein GP486_004718 [Trichoglossum hirsutum]
MILKAIIPNLALVAFCSALAIAIPTGDHDMRSGSPMRLDLTVRSTVGTSSSIASLKRSVPGGIGNFPANLAMFPGAYLGNIINQGAPLEVSRRSDRPLNNINLQGVLTPQAAGTTSLMNHITPGMGDMVNTNMPVAQMTPTILNANGHTVFFTAGLSIRNPRQGLSWGDLVGQYGLGNLRDAVNTAIQNAIDRSSLMAEFDIIQVVPMPMGLTMRIVVAQVYWAFYPHNPAG